MDLDRARGELVEMTPRQAWRWRRSPLGLTETGDRRGVVGNVRTVTRDREIRRAWS